MPIMRQDLDETDRRIVAALVASPRATWRDVGRCLDLSERTVVRRAVPLYADGTLRATVVRSPMHFRGLVPMALRIRCRPNRIRQVANALARRGDTIWVDILGGGDEISAVFFLDGPDARNALLLRDLPATDAVRSWTAHTMLRVFPAAFRWTGGLLSAEEIARLTPVAATVGPTNLLVALAVTDQDAVYGFLVDTIGPLHGITAIETTLLLATAKRTGLARRSSRLLD
jgi:DNA-binding Lrp family transcriptional regulator